MTEHRSLVWHLTGPLRVDRRAGPAFYLDAAHDALAVRIDAETAPGLADAEFDIQVDGVSVFENRTPTPVATTGRVALVTVTATAMLPKGQNREENAEDFKGDLTIEAGSWVTCIPRATGGGENFTITLELERVGEHEE